MRRLCSRCPPRRINRLIREKLDLPHQEALLVRELVVLGAVPEEVRQELQQTSTVFDQDMLDRDGFVGIGHKDLLVSGIPLNRQDTYLENVEALVLDHLLVILEQVHTMLELLLVSHVSDHHIVVRSVQQDLPEELDALALGDIGV